MAKDTSFSKKKGSGRDSGAAGKAKGRASGGRAANSGKKGGDTGKTFKQHQDSKGKGRDSDKGWKGKTDSDEKKAAEATNAEDDEEELDDAALLLREIKSLGGDEEDFAFLQDVNSEDEAIENETVADKNLAKDLKSFMASLGDFGQAYSDTEEDEDAEEDGDAVEGVEDGTGSDSEDDSEEDISSQQEGTAPPAVQAKGLEPPTAVAQASSSSTNPAPISRSGMLVDPNPLWYEIELPQFPSAPADFAEPSLKTIEQLQTRGSELLTEINEIFSGSLTNDSKHDKLAMSSTLSTSDRTFISTILTSGTSSDKLSALILLSSSSPLHTMTYLNQLMTLTKKKSRDEAVRAIRAVVDWMKGGAGGPGTGGLPDRKLKWFAEQPELKKVVYARQGAVKKNGKQEGDECLLVWAFEDWLKKWYFDLLKSIETLAHDPLPFVRTQMTGFLAALLAGKPEQEQNLLRLLVDKLGDSDRTVSSRTSYHLLQILQQHPMMKNIVVKEVAALVLRPTASAPTAVAAYNTNLHGKKAGAGKGESSGPSAIAGIRSSDHSRYYGIITLNQIMLTRTPQDKIVANRLIEVYFDIFNDLLGSHSEDDEIAGGKQEELKDRKQRRDEKKGKRKRDDDSKLKALPRKERRQIEKSQQALEAESKIMAAVLTGVNRAYPYSEIEGDVLHKRVDVLFRIIHTGTFNVGMQAMNLIFQVSSKQQAVSDRFYRCLYDTLTDPRLAQSSKQAMYLNLLFKAIKADASAKRVAAFVKRIAQVLGSHQPPFICGSLYLLGELFGITPSLRNMLTDPEEADDDVENFKDAREPGEEALEDESTSVAPVRSSSTRYDGVKRDPQYANAQNSCLWELVPLLYHFHPSVALHASQLLAATPITTTPDLELHTVSHFLDRFVYRNAKKNVGGKESLMKPGAKGLDRSGMVLMRKGTASTTENRENADEFVKRKEEDIPVDQLFFHKFFNQKLEDEKSREVKSEKRKRRGVADADDENISIDGLDEGDSDDGDDDVVLTDVEEADIDEDEIWKAMKSSMPKAGVDDDDLLDDPEEDSEDDEDLAQYNYSDSGSELGVDAELAEGMHVDGEDDGEDLEETPSFFPDEDDDDELDGFGEEDDDVLGSDEDIMLGDGVKLPKGASKAGQPEESKRAKKRKLKHLPAFASADDWKAIIDAGDSDN